METVAPCPRTQLYNNTTYSIVLCCIVSLASGVQALTVRSGVARLLHLVANIQRPVQVQGSGSKITHFDHVQLPVHSLERHKFLARTESAYETSEKRARFFQRGSASSRNIAARPE